VSDTVSKIVRLLFDEVPARRSAAAIVLAELAPEDDATLEALREAAKRTDDPTLRRWVVRAIGAIAPRSIVGDLQPLIKDPTREVRDAVKEVLATSPAVKEAEIARMLESSDDKERMAAIAVLGAMGNARARKRLLGFLRGANSRVQGAIIDALRPGLHEADERTKKKVIDELDALLEQDAVVADPDFAIGGLQILGHVDHEEGARVMVRLATYDADEQMRVEALEGAQRLLRGRHAKQFEKLFGILEDGSASAVVRAACLNVLSNLEVPVTMEARVRALATQDSTTERRWALKALGRIDSAPAAETLAKVIETGAPEDRHIAIESAQKTPRGRAAMAKLLGRLTDEERAREVARGLRDHAETLTPDTQHTLEEAVLEAPAEIGALILDVLKRSGGGRELQGNLLDRAVQLKAQQKHTDAATLLRSLVQSKDSDVEARFQLGVCELKLSKKKIARGANNDPCLATFSELLKHKEFPVLKRVTTEPGLDAEELFYLGFSFAERGDAEQGFGGDVLAFLADSGDEKVAARAHNKLKTMGWVE
jgi:HEAT repeat protein